MLNVQGMSRCENIRGESYVLVKMLVTFQEEPIGYPTILRGHLQGGLQCLPHLHVLEIIWMLWGRKLLEKVRRDAARSAVEYFVVERDHDRLNNHGDSG